MGTLFKKKGSKQWQMGISVSGRQICKSAHTTNKGIAKKLLARWETDAFEGRFHLPKTNSPTFEAWAVSFLETVSHPNTKRRYTSSIGKLRAKFAEVRLSDISADGIDEYKESRLAEGVEPATVNHDLRVLGRMLRLAERKRFISHNPFAAVEPLRQRAPRMPHIVTFEEEEKIIAVAAPHIRALVVLILWTGLRSHREALALKWEDVDFVKDFIRVRESKTRAGIRSIPLSGKCKRELYRWRDMVGPEYSPFVFPNMRLPTKPLKDVRHTWAKALADANLKYFWIYNLRHSFASRLSAAGVTDLFVAQMIGHSTPGILQKYSKAIDEYRVDAVRKLENMHDEHARTLLEPATTSIN